MIVRFINEYGDNVFISNNSSMIPRIDETVIVDEEEYRVSSVVWQMHNNLVVVELRMPTNNRTEGEPVNDTVGLREMTSLRRDIEDLRQSRETSNKTTRALSDSLQTIRKHINQRIQEENKKREY